MKTSPGARLRPSQKSRAPRILNTTQVGAFRISVIMGFHMKLPTWVSTVVLAAARLSEFRLDHCWPRDVNTQAPPAARLLVASMTAATMASSRSQTPTIRNSSNLDRQGEPPLRQLITDC